MAKLVLRPPNVLTLGRAKPARDRLPHSGLTAGKPIVGNFAALSDQEKREVLANLLRISKEIAYPPVTDEELVASADAVFLEYDKREAGE